MCLTNPFSLMNVCFLDGASVGGFKTYATYETYATHYFLYISCLDGLAGS